MKYLLFTLGGLLAALLLASVISAAAEHGPRYDPVQAAREEATIARYEAEAARARALEPLDLALAAAWRVLPLAAASLALLGAAAWGSAAIIRFRRERWPDRAGLLPVQAADLPMVGPQALGAFHAARQLEAQQQPVPHTITYSPHAAYHHRSDGPGAPLLPAALPAPGGAPAFAELLEAGRVGVGPDGRALPLLLGVDMATGAELVGSWLDLYSTAVAGLPGAGKTTTQRFLAAQTALMGARFVVVDPQAEAGEESLAGTLAPLSAAYLCQAAADDRAILQAVRLVDSIGRARVQGRDADMTPVILWADELTALLGRSSIGPDLAQLLEAVAQEYRKKRVFVCGSGQIWTAARTSSELRDSFASVIAHRMKRGQARMLLPTEEAAQAERLETGRAILWRTNGATATIAIPNTTAADIRRVAELLAGPSGRTAQAPAPAPADRPPLGFRPPAYGGATAGAPEGVAAVPLRPRQDAAKLTAEEATIVAAFLDGRSPSDLAAELAGGKKSGDAYAVAARRVADILRKALGKGATHAA